MKLNIDGHRFETSIKAYREGYEITINNILREKKKKNTLITSVEGPLIHTDKNTHEVRTILNRDGTYSITIGQDTYAVEIMSEKSSDSKFLRSPMQGMITAVKVREGNIVKKGQTLVKLISMKMENEIRADKDAKVLQVNAAKNQTVNKGDVLMEFEK